MILEDVELYKEKVKLSENEDKTVKQYEGYVLEFIKWAEIKSKEDITKQKLIDFKEYMLIQYKTSTINIKIVILNSFTNFLGFSSEYKLEQLTVQEKATIENVLSQTDYERLLRIADRKAKIRTKYIMKVLAETGIRISELKHITVEAVKKGIAVFDSKGTVERKAFINKKLQKELLKYCKEKGITSGIIFKSRNGNPLNEAYIYKEIQWVARTSQSK